MSEKIDDPGWPPEAGDLGDLPDEMEPPAELEERVTHSLLRRGLISATGRPVTAVRSRSTQWRRLLATAASLLLVATGFLAGRFSAGEAGTSGDPATGGRARYALLLYETPDYDRAVGTEARERYAEYSRWVAYARGREQFVTGEDLEVDDGWIVSPGADGLGFEKGTAVPAAPALSGIFLVTGSSEAEVLELAEALPHLRHGGHVVVQKTIPTEEPPQPGAG